MSNDNTSINTLHVGNSSFVSFENINTRMLYLTEVTNSSYKNVNLTNEDSLVYSLSVTLSSNIYFENVHWVPDALILLAGTNSEFITFINCSESIMTGVTNGYTPKLWNDYILVDSSANVEFLLNEELRQKGKVIHIKDQLGNASNQNITISVDGGTNIDGETSVTISVNYGSITLLCDGTNWSII